MGAMRFAELLSLLAACPGLGSRIGSQPHTNTTVENLPLKDACDWCHQIRNGKNRDGNDLFFKVPSVRFYWQEQNPEDPKKRPRAYCQEVKEMQGFEAAAEEGSCGQFFNSTRMEGKDTLEVGSIGFEHSIPEEVDLTRVNREYCRQCHANARKHIDHWFFYTSKIDVVDGEKRLIARCAPKQPEENEGFAQTNVHSIRPHYCGHSDHLKIPDDEASGVRRVKFDFSTASDRCNDILPDCEKCAEKFVSREEFWWKAEGEGSRRTISTMCDTEPPDSKGWERNPPPPKNIGPRITITKEWCQNTFKDECGTIGGRGPFFWLKLLGILVVVVAAAAGLYLASKRKADEDESTM